MSELVLQPLQKGTVEHRQAGDLRTHRETHRTQASFPRCRKGLSSELTTLSLSLFSIQDSSTTSLSPTKKTHIDDANDDVNTVEHQTDVRALLDRVLVWQMRSDSQGDSRRD